MNVNWEALGAIGELIAAAGVIVTLAYLAIQVRANTVAQSAQSRHSLSEFVLQVSLFRAEHADRIAKLDSGEPLTPGDLEFRYWLHAQLMLHAETYFHHVELGLMPASHWNGYQHYFREYVTTNGFEEAWASIGPGFSENFRGWVDGLLAEHRRANGEDAAPG